MNKKFLKNDLILIFSIIVISLLSVTIILITSKQGNYVTIEQNGTITAVLQINKNQKYNIYNEDNEIENTILIENGQVSMIYANCPDKICEKHKAIKNNNESIICLPNKVIVTVTNNLENEVDGVAK